MGIWSLLGFANRLARLPATVEVIQQLRIADVGAHRRQDLLARLNDRKVLSAGIVFVDTFVIEFANGFLTPSLWQALVHHHGIEHLVGLRALTRACDDRFHQRFLLLGRGARIVIRLLHVGQILLRHGVRSR